MTPLFGCDGRPREPARRPYQTRDMAQLRAGTLTICNRSGSRLACVRGSPGYWGRTSVGGSDGEGCPAGGSLGSPPRRRPMRNAATTAQIAPTPMSTQAHVGSPLSVDWPLPLDFAAAPTAAPAATAAPVGVVCEVTVGVTVVVDWVTVGAGCLTVVVAVTVGVVCVTAAPVPSLPSRSEAFRLGCRCVPA